MNHSDGLFYKITGCCIAQILKTVETICIFRLVFEYSIYI